MYPVPVLGPAGDRPYGGVYFAVQLNFVVSETDKIKLIGVEGGTVRSGGGVHGIIIPVDIISPE
jgi:hypothetical protein